MLLPGLFPSIKFLEQHPKGPHRSPKRRSMFSRLRPTRSPNAFGKMGLAREHLSTMENGSNHPFSKTFPLPLSNQESPDCCKNPFGSSPRFNSGKIQSSSLHCGNPLAELSPPAKIWCWCSSRYPNLTRVPYVHGVIYDIRELSLTKLFFLNFVGP